MDSSEEQSSPPKTNLVRKRSWLRPQFSLRLLLIAITLVAGFVWVEIERRQAAEEAEAIELLRQLCEAQWHYASDYDRDGNLIVDAPERVPSRFEQWLWPRFLDPIVTLDLTVRGLGSFAVYGALDREAWELLSRFRKVRRLTIGADCSQFDVSDLKNLRHLESLSLDYYDTQTPFPIAAINQLSSLKELDLAASWFQCYQPCDEPCLFRLKKLRLKGPLVDSANVFSDFGDLSRLESLRISKHTNRTKAKLSLESMSDLHALKEMILINQKIADTSEIYECATLEKIHLSGVESVVGFLANVDRAILPNLKEIHVELARVFDAAGEQEKKIEYLGTFKNFPTLEKIALHDHGIKKIDALPDLPNLRELVLGCTRLETFDAPLNQIETLICSAEKIKRLNFLSSPDCRLRRLSVDCGYTSEPSPNNLLDSLRFAKNLERLDIVRSDIESLDFLNGCKNLKRISLQGNGQLVNIDALSDSADSLESITLAYNRQLLEHGVLEKEMSQLKELVVYDALTKNKFLDNLHLDLKGDLNRFDHLEVPNRAIIGRKFEWQDIWNFTNELNLEN